MDWILAGLCATRSAAHGVMVAPSSVPPPAGLRSLELEFVEPATPLELPDRPADVVFVSSEVPLEALGAVLEQLVSSPSTDAAILAIEGAGEPERRAVVDGVHLEAWAKVARIDLDALPARVLIEPPHQYALHGGLACVELDAAQAAAARDPRPAGWYPAVAVIEAGAEALEIFDGGPPELPALRDDLRAAHLRALQAQVDPVRLRSEVELRAIERQHQHLLGLYLTVVNSSSWRVTAPLRAVAARLRAGAARPAQRR